MSVRLLRETFEPELLTPDSRLQEGDGAVVEVHTLFHDMDCYMSQTKMPDRFIAIQLTSFLSIRKLSVSCAHGGLSQDDISADLSRCSVGMPMFS